jgi:hypothetical protein
VREQEVHERVAEEVMEKEVVGEEQQKVEDNEKSE